MKEKSTEQTRRFAFFQHLECEKFPCHGGVPKSEFNCLFCYCPLYGLGADCGGAFTYTEKGIKSCIGCDFPHHRDNYDAVLRRISEVVRKTARPMRFTEGEKK